MSYLTEPFWIVGKPGNGNRDVWQCPSGCEKNVDYSGAIGGAMALAEVFLK